MGRGANHLRSGALRPTTQETADWVPPLSPPLSCYCWLLGQLPAPAANPSAGGTRCPPDHMPGTAWEANRPEAAPGTHAHCLTHTCHPPTPTRPRHARTLRAWWCVAVRGSAPAPCGPTPHAVRTGLHVPNGGSRRLPQCPYYSSGVIPRTFWCRGADPCTPRYRG